MTRRRHPLLQAFPAAVMAIAAFLVLFALMTARLRAGRDPALGPAAAAVVRPSSGRGSVLTRASGSGGVPAAGAPAAEGQAASAVTPATRASGGARISDD